MKIRKLLRILHRDFGYFIVAMTIVYAVSGIYLNHRHDFNPDYKIIITDFKHDLQPQESYPDDEIQKLWKRFSPMWCIKNITLTTMAI
ncbi:hypothetical protein [Draconibacterium orientale]|uniref:hypothetical protein n=1 Tax=Draconibacterium orientale TaxID=1168034 RepID=UPI0029C057A3|nr:hypothetical protein [Draconibacterium orientale]